MVDHASAHSSLTLCQFAGTFVDVECVSVGLTYSAQTTAVYRSNTLFSSSNYNYALLLPLTVMLAISLLLTIILLYYISKARIFSPKDTHEYVEEVGL